MSSSAGARFAIRPEPFEAPDSIAMRREAEADLVERYGRADVEPGPKPTTANVAAWLVVRDASGQAVGCGALRAVTPGVVEIKRMWVRPRWRGQGAGAALLAALEEHARGLGASRVVLETGPRQHEAIALYERFGYQSIECWGPYAGGELSLCYARELSPSARS